MTVRRGYPQFPSLFSNCVCWYTGLESNEFPIIPSGVTVTPNGTFYKDDLGNNKQVVMFDGSTNYISLSDHLNLRFGTFGHSICFWYKPTVFKSSTKDVIIAKGYGASVKQWRIEIVQSTHYINFETYNGSTEYNTTGTEALTTGQWYHITCIKTFSGTKIIYVNGILYASSSDGNIDTDNSSYNLILGVLGSAYSNKITGNIKDLMIFKGRALIAPEIKLLMNRTHPITGAGLLPGGYDYYVDVV